jgi:hypothetical protein
MSERLANVKYLPDDQFVDPSNRRWAIRDQSDVDQAAREIGAGRASSVRAMFTNNGGGDPAERKRLVRMARDRGLTVPIGFAAEAIQHRIDQRGVPYGEKAISPGDVEILAMTEVGRAALLEYGISPLSGELAEGSGGLATFSTDSSGEPPIPESERNQVLAGFEKGREELCMRGMSETEIKGLQRSIGG